MICVTYRARFSVGAHEVEIRVAGAVVCVYGVRMDIGSYIVGNDCSMLPSCPLCDL